VEAVTAALVPELLVTDIKASLDFWCGLIGFVVKYQRPEEKFAYLTLHEAQVMLEQQIDGERQWITGNLTMPRGRGVNFQIEVEAISGMLDRLGNAGWPLYLAAEERWYRRNTTLLGQRQFLVQDPDGYLLRLFESLGEKAAE
jgi:catechol 2,3-dioxygenase-like lactoylglutathione lyase family enzyme